MRRNPGLLAVTIFLVFLGSAAADARLTASPPQGSIVFSRADAYGRYSLWTIGAETQRLRQVTRGCGWDWFPAWSPDRRQIAFARACGKFQPGSYDLDLYVIGVDGKGLRRLVHTSTNDEWPTWSPDGSKIAFVSGEPQWSTPRRGETAAELWVVGSNGRGLKRLTRNAVPDAAPAWSPDGKQIAFTSGRRGHNGIWVVATDGGRARALGLVGGEAAWSPDGTRLAFAHRRSGLHRETVDLYVANADGSAQRRLTHEPVGVVSHHPSWSADGRSIVYMTNRESAQVSLWVIGANGRNAHRLTSSPSEDADPEWSRPM